MLAIRRLRGSYQGLLVSLLLLLVLAPFASETGLPAVLFEGLFSFVLLTGVISASAKRGFPYVAMALGVTALILRWGVHLDPSPILALPALATTLLFLAVAELAVLRDLLSAPRVSTDIVLGGICGYLLLGTAWAVGFQLLEVAGWGATGGMDPTAFGSLTAFYGRAEELSDLLYLSFVTLTTLGYGDIVPLTRAARLLATLEALAGQLYIAILIARLVALHLVHAERGD